MTKTYIFLVSVLIIIIIAAIVLFKNFKTFFACLFSFLFSGYYVFWKDLWDKHYRKSLEFTGYLLIVGILSTVAFIIIKYSIK